MKYDAATIWRVYRLRANCENQIKALKEDFGLSSFVKDYWATEVALTFAMLTANLGKFVSQNLFTFEEKPPHAVHFATRFSGASPILIE